MIDHPELDMNPLREELARRRARRIQRRYRWRWMARWRRRRLLLRLLAAERDLANAESDATRELCSAEAARLAGELARNARRLYG